MNKNAASKSFMHMFTIPDITKILVMAGLVKT